MATTSKNNATVELFLTRNQINGLMYVIDCFLRADSQHKYGQFAKKMQNKVLKHSAIFFRDDEETIKLHLFESDVAIMLKLFSTYISAVQEMPRDYFTDIVDAKKASTISS